MSLPAEEDLSPAERVISHPTDTFLRSHQRLLAEINVVDPQVVDPPSYPSMLPGDLLQIDSESGHHRNLFEATRDSSALDALIASLRSAINKHGEHRKRRSRLLYELGCALTEQFKGLNIRSAISEAIDVFQEALSYDCVPDSLSNRTPIIINLLIATSMAVETPLQSQDQTHITRVSNMHDRNEAISPSLEVHLRVSPSTDVNHLSGEQVAQAFSRALQSLINERSAPDEAISQLRSAIDICQDAVDDASSSLLFAELGTLLLRRFKETKNRGTLDESIDMLRKALNLRSSGDQSRLVSAFRSSKDRQIRLQADGFTDCAIWQMQLRNALAARCNLNGQPSERDELIECERLLINNCPNKLDNLSRSTLFSWLGESLRGKFLFTGNNEALDEAIRMFQIALDLRTSGDQDHSTSLLSIITDDDEHDEAQQISIPRQLATKSSEAADNKALSEFDVCQLPLEVKQPPAKACARLLHKLAFSLWERSRIHGNTQDLTDAIRLFEEALPAFPSNDSERCIILRDFGNALTYRYEVSGDIQDLNEGVALYQEAKGIGAGDIRFYSETCVSMAATLLERYILCHDDKCLDEALSLLEQVVDSFSQTDSNRWVALYTLSRCLRCRYLSSGDIMDLDRALNLARELDRYPGPDRASRLEHMAWMLLGRYQETGNDQDLDDAMSVQSECLELRPPGNPARWSTFFTLGTANSERFKRTAEISYLDETINCYREALLVCPRNNVTRAMVMGSLAYALTRAYDCNASPVHLEEAFAMLKEALGLSPPDHVERQRTLNILANVCMRRYNLHQHHEDLQEAIERHFELESCLPDDHPWQCFVRGRIAWYLFHDRHQPDSSFRKALLMYRRAVQHVTASAEVRFKIALEWVNSARHRRHGSIMEAYGYAMNLLQRRLLTNPTADLQHQLLARLPKSFASDAAASVIEVGEVKTAVELLEQGRGLLWSQLSRYNHPLDALGNVNPSLAEKFKTVSKKLEKLALSSSRGIAFTDSNFLMRTPLDKQMEELHALSKQWDNVVEQIRLLDGFSDFLSAVPFDRLQKAAADGPVIIVNVSMYRCDAIIIRDGESPVVVPLPQLTEEKLQEACVSLFESLGNLHERNIRLDLMNIWKKITHSIQKWFESSNKHGVAKQKHSPYAGIRHVLRYLWTSIVGPVVARLDEMSIKHQSRIWWCPTSMLCHLPLHAAGPYEEGKPDLPDLYISSYLVTLSSFDVPRRVRGIPMSQEKISLKPPMLVIACPGHEGANDFLYSVEEEVAEIAYAWISGSESPLTHLEGEDASYNTVLSQLPHHPWVHFACHGQQHPKPFESSFKLQDGRHLTLVDLMRARVENAELAFLSACNTATGDIGGTPDEGLHLASAMQYCGFRSVVGTLWPMADDDGPYVSRDFYVYLLNEGKGEHRSSAAALHRAVQKMRERNVPIYRWINFVHYGA